MMIINPEVGIIVGLLVLIYVTWDVVVVIKLILMEIAVLCFVIIKVVGNQERKNNR